MRMSFKGGIHPPENKKAAEGKKFVNLSIPQLCYIPMQQHIGSPAEPIVEVGNTVTEGQLIGKASGFVSSNIHASIPGKVVEITENSFLYNNNKAIVIETEGSFSSTTSDLADWKLMSKADILKKINDAGIVGLGGAAFPTSVKLSPPKDKKIETLVVNGAECEPYLTVDDMLMQTYPKEIIEGILITLKLLGINKSIIGIENNKPRALAILKKIISEENLKNKIKIVSLKTIYPQGAEKQLIRSLLKKEVPSGSLPMDIGVVVQNVGTIYAIRQAVTCGKPLFERFLTISGSMINKPGNYKARIGTKISDIVEECGGLKGEPAKIILGGPMCGTAIYDLNIPVVKGTSGILFLSKDEINTDDYSGCIRCGRCVSICPSGLMPADLGLMAEKGIYDDSLNPFDCIMCGSCSYICPSRRPLTHFIKLIQSKLREKK